MVADLPNVDCCEAPEVSRDVNEAPLLDFGLSIAPDLMALRPPTPPPNLGRGGGGGEQSGPRHARTSLTYTLFIIYLASWVTLTLRCINLNVFGFFFSV